jgi:hypothetical protein
LSLMTWSSSPISRGRGNARRRFPLTCVFVTSPVLSGGSPAGWPVEAGADGRARACNRRQSASTRRRTRIPHHRPDVSDINEPGAHNLLCPRLQ